MYDADGRASNGELIETHPVSTPCLTNCSDWLPFGALQLREQFANHITFV